MWPDPVVDDSVWIPRAQRVAFDVPVRFRSGGRRTTLTLRNLTRTGARVEGLATLRAGDMAMIQLPTLAPKAARVAWTRGDAAGLEFERALHPDIFEALVREHAVARARTVADTEPEPEDLRLHAA